MSKQCIEKYIDKNGNVIYRSSGAKLRIIISGAFKLILDKIFAVLGIIILFPLIILISFLIKMDSEGPIFFRQKRTGKNGKIFNVIKFRTMFADNNLRDTTIADQHTRIGKILRKTSLDEIPQLFNILIGRMSFVGPRPWIPEYFENMNGIQRQRYFVKPGLTGLAQVNGRNHLTILEKINYDLEYVEKFSLVLDIKIFLLSVYTVLTTKGHDAGKALIRNEIECLKNSNKV